jgi:hypothetical protein
MTSISLMLICGITSFIAMGLLLGVSMYQLISQFVPQLWLLFLVTSIFTVLLSRKALFDRNLAGMNITSAKMNITSANR